MTEDSAEPVRTQKIMNSTSDNGGFVVSDLKKSMIHRTSVKEYTSDNGYYRNGIEKSFFPIARNHCKYATTSESKKLTFQLLRAEYDRWRPLSRANIFGMIPN